MSKIFDIDTPRDITSKILYMGVRAQARGAVMCSRLDVFGWDEPARSSRAGKR